MNLSDPPHADPARPDPSRERLARILARLDTLVDWEKRDRSPGMRRGLAPMEDLMARLGSPQASFRAVHVAGTKGKGSTASLIAAGLARAGFSVGLYTSPHVDRVEERVRVDGRDVAAGELAEALERAFDAREAAVAGDTAADEATWFDLLTAAAFLVFQRRGVDWAVVECGLGGRLDSTNVVHGEVCVVTNIDLEHTAVLGNCFADIAREKGGIVKPGSVLSVRGRGDRRRATTRTPCSNSRPAPPVSVWSGLRWLRAATGARPRRPATWPWPGRSSTSSGPLLRRAPAARP